MGYRFHIDDITDIPLISMVSFPIQPLLYNLSTCHHHLASHCRSHWWFGESCGDGHVVGQIQQEHLVFRSHQMRMFSPTNDYIRIKNTTRKLQKYDKNTVCICIYYLDLCSWHSIFLYIFVPTYTTIFSTPHLARVGDSAHDIAAASEGNVRHLMERLGILEHKYRG